MESTEFMVQGGLKCRSQWHGKMPVSGRQKYPQKGENFNGEFFRSKKIKIQNK